MPANETQTEVLAGLVERVTFHNEDNGFCVLRVKARGKRDVITVIGHAATISAGEFIQASGDWINDRTHGVQSRARFLKAMPPTTAEGIEKYLGSGMIRGIGPVYARKLVRAFGTQVTKSFAASGKSSSRGRPQCPSSRASVKAKELPARARIIAVFSMPSFMATASAVLKPMPRMSRASR